MKFTRWLSWLTHRTRRPAARLPSAQSIAEDAFQAALELAADGVILLDGSGRVLALNSHAQALTHSGLGALQGVDFWEALPEAITDRHRGAAELALRSDSRSSFVSHYAFEDQWVEYQLRQQADGMIVNLRDVSAEHHALRSLRESEAGQKTLFDAHPVAMWLYDPASRRLLAANQASAALYGQPLEDAAGRSVEIFFPDGEGAALLDSLPAGDFHGEMRLCTQKKTDGERMLVELVCASIHWQLRPAVLVSVVDVGARHLADAQLRQRNDELELGMAQSTLQAQSSRKELETFLYAMSHDLKAPLHVVSGFARTLAERYSPVLDHQGQHFLERIQASTRQLAKLIDDLRTLSYLPRVTLVPETVDLVPVCQRLLDELGKREPERQVLVEMPAELLVTCDKHLLVTALSCLLDNAWKFTSRKEQGWIKVGLVPGSDPGDAVICVSDNGVGFDAAYAQKLFTAFQRLHSTADFPGSGLGLAIVQRVAQLHGGQAWGVTANQGGASFFLSLPQVAATHVPDAPA
ncbi:MAG: ATP-binding protein [Polaromonas sp.]|nr:ATP-binding protein [Archangium sp.]MDP3750991.1 ATP-binding protein [Polaromonas sp.]